MIPVVDKNSKIKLPLALPTGAPITQANGSIETAPLATDKAIKDLSRQSKEAIYLLNFFLLIPINSLSGISEIL